MAARQFASDKLVIASHNKGKVVEIRDLMRPLAVNVVSAAELDLDEPEETGSTFVANAELKARAAAGASGLPSLADDSGLVVHALDGEPGIYSARWAGPQRDFRLAMERVERELTAKGNGNRRAHFTAVLSLCWPDGHCESFEGRVSGQLTWPPRGERGFGYDPMFLPDGFDRTFGEMTSEEKHGLPPGGRGLSHRARAFIKLAESCL